MVRTTTRGERKKVGKEMRGETPCEVHGEWAATAGRPNPISLLQAQDEDQVEQLLLIKYSRIPAKDTILGINKRSESLQ